MTFFNFNCLNLQVRSQLEEDLGGQDLTSRKDEINGIIKQVMDEMDEDEDDEDDDGGGDDDDGSDFDPGSEEDRKKKKVSFPTLGTRFDARVSFIYLDHHSDSASLRPSSL